ncbi:MAG: antibiotic biosynthesis monooxygenase [Bacteroidales bacterium]|nr:antibiotic biosynthesis monooxygenase [Bacteroidales bacterium]
MIVRISEIEVYPEYLKEYLEFAHNVGATSVREEPGVICIYPMQQLKDDCQIRILEIYASQEAYQHHIKTAHFQTYKQGTLHMVKSLELVDMRQMAPECLPLIFNKAKINDSDNMKADKELNGSWPKGNPNDAYAQYFTGNSYLAPIQPKNLASGEKTIQGYSNVTFEPGCRNNWHIHHGAHQILICVSGEGIYQEWGKPAIHLHAGDIIDIPEGVKHWHGATKDSWFQHLASHIHVNDPESNEWLEAVSDDQYAAANI